MAQPVYPSAPPQAPKSSKGLTLILVLVVGLPILVAIFGVVAAVGIYGVRKYIFNAKAAEGRNAVAFMARDAITCSERGIMSGALEGEPGPALVTLPPTTTPVPSALADVSGKKYLSTASDWTGPGWDCIGFNFASPQYFQYQWERLSPTRGVAKAQADLNGDGVAEVRFELPVECSDAHGQFACRANSTIIEHIDFR